MKTRLPFDKKFLIWCLTLLVVGVLLLKVSSGAAFALMIPLMLWAIGTNKSEYLFFFLLMTVVYMTGNHKIISKNGVFWLCERGMMLMLALVMSVQIIGRRNSRLIAPLMTLLIFLAYMIIPSMVGWSPLISGLKLYMFTSVYLAYYGIANRVIMDERYNIYRIRSVMLAYAAFLLVGSVLLIPFPGIGQMSPYEMSAEDLAAHLADGGTSLFMGMTSHSQLMGPLTAIVGVMVLGDFLFSMRKFNWVYAILNLCPIILIYKTSSRTAMASYLIGVVILIFCFMNARGIRRIWRFKVVNFSIFCAVLALLSALLVPQVREKVLKFALKYGGADANVKQMTLEDVTSTRQGKWDEGIYNWKKSPAIGNGFQVAPEMAAIKGDNLNELMSAPVEKSIWISAVLEEGGIFGFLIFVGWLLYVTMQFWKRHVYIGLSCFLTMVVINLGEFSIFSMGYTGGILWATIIAAVVMDAQRYKQEQKEQRDKEIQEMTMRQMLAGWING